MFSNAETGRRKLVRFAEISLGTTFVRPQMCFPLTLLLAVAEIDQAEIGRSRIHPRLVFFGKHAVNKIFQRLASFWTNRGICCAVGPWHSVRFILKSDRCAANRQVSFIFPATSFRLLNLAHWEGCESMVLCMPSSRTLLKRMEALSATTDDTWDHQTAT